MKISQFIPQALVMSVTLLTAASNAWSQAYPDRPIKLIVGYGAGSAIDSVARAVTQHMTGTLGQPIVVENRPGAAGDIGTIAAAQGKPDGYTILITSTSGFITELAGASKVELQKTFTPVSISGRAPWVLAVSATSPHQSVKDVVEFARKNPGKLDYVTVGGGMPQFLGEILAKSENLQIVPVPYKSTADALPDVMAGRVALWITPMVSAVAMHKGGKVRVLGVGGDARPEILKDVPTMKEQGFPAIDTSSTYYFFAPAGTPVPILQRLNHAVNEALTDSGVKESLGMQGVLPIGGSIGEMGQLMTAEFDRWSRVVKTGK